MNKKVILTKENKINCQQPTLELLIVGNYKFSIAGRIIYFKNTEKQVIGKNCTAS